MTIDFRRIAFGVAIGFTLVVMAWLPIVARHAA
jgi:hypothetical protein